MLGRLRLAETAGDQWGQRFVFDGFGNLTQEVVTKGSGTTVSHLTDPATNRLLGTEYSYDNNGNLTAMPQLTMSYSVENRLVQAARSGIGTESYGYDPAGLRVWKVDADGVMHVFFNGLDGKPLAEFRLEDGEVAGGEAMVYFAGKRVDNGTVEDRLGTVVLDGGVAKAYFPYGKKRDLTEGEVQFATYKPVTGLDYAQQRWYSSQVGRFLTTDPYRSMDPNSPQSFNRYAYAASDPANRHDPTGFWVGPDGGGRWRVQMRLVGVG